MKYFLVGVAVWFILGFGIQFIKSWLWGIVFKWNKNRTNRDEQWMYEI